MITDERIEAAKTYLTGQTQLLAQELGLVVSMIWHGQGRDFDQHQQALELIVGERYVICRFSEFDLPHRQPEGSHPAAMVDDEDLLPPNLRHF